MGVAAVAVAGMDVVAVDAEDGVEVSQAPTPRHLAEVVAGDSRKLEFLQTTISTTRSIHCIDPSDFPSPTLGNPNIEFQH